MIFAFVNSPKPLLPGEVRQKAEWENLYVYGMLGCLLFYTAGQLFGPPSPFVFVSFRISISRTKEWIHQEAEQRAQEYINKRA